MNCYCSMIGISIKNAALSCYVTEASMNEQYELVCNCYHFLSFKIGVHCAGSKIILFYFEGTKVVQLVNVCYQ